MSVLGSSKIPQKPNVALCLTVKFEVLVSNARKLVMP